MNYINAVRTTISISYVIIHHHCLYHLGYHSQLSDTLTLPHVHNIPILVVSGTHYQITFVTRRSVLQCSGSVSRQCCLLFNLLTVYRLGL